MSEYEIRPAVVADADVIARQRVRMFVDMAEIGDDMIEPVESATRRRLKDELASGAYRGWVAVTAGEIVAGAGMILHPYYPNARNPLGRPAAHIFNVYTDPAHRGRGLARRLVMEILARARAEGLQVSNLHASSAGRPIYERLGFEPTNEMRAYLG